MNEPGEIVGNLSSPEPLIDEREPSPQEKRQKIWKDWIDEEFQNRDNGQQAEEKLKDRLSEKFRQLDDELTKQIQISQARSDLLNTDALSEIPSGYEFDEDIEELVRSGEKFGLLMMDIDNFKNLNKQFGHLGGDQAIRHIARTLDSAIRQNDEEKADEARNKDKVYRLHGDEVAVLLPGAEKPEDLFKISERLRKAVEANPALIGETNTVPISISIGGAVFQGGEIEDFIDMVDKKAMYTAKENGKNSSYILGLQSQKAA